MRFAQGTNPRFQVIQPAGPNMRMVWDTWLGTEVARFHQGAEDHPETATLLAETRAAELNLPSADPLGFIAKLAAWISEARESEVNSGDILEDLDRVLDHYAGQIRGIVAEPLAQDRLRHPAPWVDKHGHGA